MTIDTYATLKSAVASWLERSDLTDRIPEFISLAQAKIYRGVKGPDGRTWIIPPLRLRNMVTTADISVTAGVGALPSGWIEFVRLWVDDTDQPNLKYYPPTIWWDLYGAHNAASSESVDAYTIEGLVIRIAPPNTETLKSVHYATFTALSADGSTDWILTNAPHVYLHGALAEAGSYLRDTELEGKETAAFAAAVRGLMGAEEQAQHGGSVLVARPKAIV